MKSHEEAGSSGGPARPPVPVTTVAVIAALVAGIVVAVTLRSQEPVGAGAYYDDGAYLALARSLARGEGLVYSNLPGEVPGVKYPPVYPIVLAGAWKAFSVYPENLSALKALNALFWGLAAGCVFLLFARGDRWRVGSVAALTLYVFLTVPSMSVATVLMSEPLFVLLCAGALLLAAWDPERRCMDGSADRRPPPRRWPAWSLALGAVAAAALLTRTIGITLVIALVAPLLLARRWRASGIVTAAVAAPTLAWLAWASARSVDVPPPIAGQYGSYGSWLDAGLDGGVLARMGQVAAANWAPLIETLQFVWVPRASGAALALVLAVLAAATAFGAVVAWRRVPALVLFLASYLAIAFVWPYEPYRFYYAVLPFLTLLALDGLWEAAPRIRGDLPRWGVPVAVAVGAIFAVNALAYHGRGHAVRAWASPQTVTARAYAPLIEWIRSHTAQETVIASALDPYVHWQTGRPAVPSWSFLADDYGRYDRTPEALAAGLDSIIVRYGPEYVALILGENKAARTLEAFAKLHPERARRVLQTEGPTVGVVYAVAPPGQALWDPAEEASEGAAGGESEAGAVPPG